MLQRESTEPTMYKIYYKVDDNTNRELCKLLRKCNGSTTNIKIKVFESYEILPYEIFINKNLGDTVEEIERYTYLERFDSITFVFPNEYDGHLEITYKRNLDSDNGLYKRELVVHTMNPHFDLIAFFEKITGEKYIPEAIPQSPPAPEPARPVKIKLNDKYSSITIIPTRAPIDDHAYIERAYSYSKDGQTSSLTYTIHADHSEYEKLANTFVRLNYNYRYLLFSHSHKDYINYCSRYKEMGYTAPDVNIYAKPDVGCDDLFLERFQKSNSGGFDYIFEYRFRKKLEDNKIHLWDKWICALCARAYDFAFPIGEDGARVHHRE